MHLPLVATCCVEPDVGRLRIIGGSCWPVPEVVPLLGRELAPLLGRGLLPLVGRGLPAVPVQFSSLDPTV